MAVNSQKALMEVFLQFTLPDRWAMKMFGGALIRHINYLIKFDNGRGRIEHPVLEAFTLNYLALLVALCLPSAINMYWFEHLL